MLDCTRELFARHELRCTRQRLALYEALRACTSHPTAEELYRMTQPSGSGLSRATVYNTLEALCRAGLVRKLPTTTGCCRFDADISEHVHMRFRDSHEIRDVPADLGERLFESLPQEIISKIEQTLGVKIDDVNIQLIAQRSPRTD